MNRPLNRKLLVMAQLVLSVSYASFAYSNTPLDQFAGPWLTDDGKSLVIIKACDNNLEELCGYLSGFPETSNASMNKALCGIRIFGGLKPIGKTLKGGWFFDIETGNAYDLEVKAKKSNTVISLRIYQGTALFGETFIWTQHRDLTDTSPVKFCNRAAS